MTTRSGSTSSTTRKAGRGPSRGVTDAERLYHLAGDVLRLGGRPRTTEEGEILGGHLYWELLRHRPE